jgi:hypothetical protein
LINEISVVWILSERLDGFGDLQRLFVKRFGPLSVNNLFGPEPDKIGNFDTHELLSSSMNHGYLSIDDENFFPCS